MRAGLWKRVSHVCMPGCARTFNGSTPCTGVWMCILDGTCIDEEGTTEGEWGDRTSLLNHHLNLKASFGSPPRSSCDANGLTLYLNARNTRLLTHEITKNESPIYSTYFLRVFIFILRIWCVNNYQCCVALFFSKLAHHLFAICRNTI